MAAADIDTIFDESDGDEEPNFVVFCEGDILAADEHVRQARRQMEVFGDSENESDFEFEDAANPEFDDADIADDSQRDGELHIDKDRPNDQP